MESELNNSNCCGFSSYAGSQSAPIGPPPKTGFLEQLQAPVLDKRGIPLRRRSTLRAPGGRQKWISSNAKNVRPLATTAAALADEVLASGEAFDLRGSAAALASRPVLIIAAEKANAPSNRRISESLERADGKSSKLIIMPTDHGFNDHRIALISASLEWLEQFKPAAPR